MLKDLTHDWKIQNNKLFLTTTQKDFMACVDLINKIAQIAQEKDHHPNLCIKDYKTLEIEIYTHDENNITEKDWELAKEIDTLLS